MNASQGAAREEEAIVLKGTIIEVDDNRQMIETESDQPELKRVLLYGNHRIPNVKLQDRVQVTATPDGGKYRFSNGHVLGKAA